MKKLVLLTIGIVLICAYLARTQTSSRPSSPASLSNRFSPADNKSIAPHAHENSASSPLNLSSQLPEHREIKKWLSSEALEMDRPQSRPDEIETKLFTKAKSLSRAEAQVLVRIISDSVKQTFNERRLALFLLSSEASRFQAELVRLIQRPINLEPYKHLSHTGQDVGENNEMTLQVQSLRALESQLLQNENLKNDLAAAARLQENPKARRMVLVSLDAAQTGQLYWTEKYNELTRGE